jgi:long-chain acyl-CoA synthetase
MHLDLELYREYIEVEPGVTISFIDVSPERPLRSFVLIHGFGGNAKQWQYQIDTFAQHSHVIAIDLRGHGDSTRPESGFEMEHMLADVRAVLKQTAVQPKFVLVGHSFGVALATEFAFRYPEQVSHLILVAGAGEYAIRIPYRVAFSLPEWSLSALQPLADNFVDASLASLKKMYHQNLRDWRGWDKFPLLKMPTLVILGNKDQVLPPEAFQRVAELVPKQTSEVLSVDVSAHMVMLERGDAVNRAISRFIESPNLGSDTPRWRTRFEVGSRGSLLRERPWLAFYEADVPATIHVPSHPLSRLLRRSARRFPNKTAILAPGVKLKYRFILDEVLRLANALQGLGISNRSRVMLLLPNNPHLIIAYYGILEAGGIAVLGNPLASEEEIIRQANIVEAEILVTWDGNPVVRAFRDQTSTRHVIVTEPEDYFPWYHRLWINLTGQAGKGNHELFEKGATKWAYLLRQHSPNPLKVEIRATDTAVIQFTSGTSSLPKGVMLSHKNLLANVLQMRSWFNEAVDGKEMVLSITPFSHVYGMTAAMNLPISQGASLLLLPRFQIDELLRVIKKYEPSYFPGVPSMFLAMKDEPDVRKFNVGLVRTYLSSGSALPIEVEEAFEKVTKARLVESYGLIEASPLTHISPLQSRDKIGSIGLPLPSTEARIVDLETRQSLPPGQIGELLIRGPQVMQGYWRDQEATSAAIDDLGWLSTGDIARMDSDGYFQIISHSQETWRSGDAEDTIYPRDIEEIIYELPTVEEVVVVLIAGWPIAFVKVKDKSEISPNTIIAYCRRRLPPNLVPRRVIFASDFPRNIIGRVLRRELAEEYESKMAATSGSVEQHLNGLAITDGESPVAIPS